MVIGMVGVKSNSNSYSDGWSFTTVVLIGMGGHGLMLIGMGAHIQL